LNSAAVHPTNAQGATGLQRLHSFPSPMAAFILVFAVGCQSPAASTRTDQAQPPPASATPAASASASEAAIAGNCLEPGAADAWHNIVVNEANDVVETADEETRLAAAEALEALELEGEEDEIRDALVDALRADPMDAEAAMDLSVAAGLFETFMSVPRC